MGERPRCGAQPPARGLRGRRPSAPQAAAAARLPRGCEWVVGSSVMAVPCGGDEEGLSARGGVGECGGAAAGLSAEGDDCRGFMEVAINQERVGLSFLRENFPARFGGSPLPTPPTASAWMCLYNEGKKSMLMFWLLVMHPRFNSCCRFPVVPYISC